tara:strand:- start:17537 stop:17842 length:306 start_codon:yes stop_codon:yes gene_type:complete
MSVSPNTPSLSTYRFGFGIGATALLFYLGCIITMATVPHEKAVVFFNSLLHGLDVEPVLRQNVPFLEAFLGMISTFVLGWLAGVIIASVYNCCLKIQTGKS